MSNTLDVEHLLNPEDKATEIAKQWQNWNSLRQDWIEDKKELRNYVFATDTRTTSNSRLPWANSTTTPKLAQIFDNLHANYTSALFPASDWLDWRGSDGESNSKDKAKVIKSYMENKIRQGNFRNTVDKILDDYILTGNCFATVDYDINWHKDSFGVTINGYIGPKLVRISPFDIVFDPTAADFASTPKIIRSIKTLGDIRRMVEKGDQKYQAIFDRILSNRSEVGSSAAVEKSEAYVADGFSSIENYYGSAYVEVLTFYGDIFDKNTSEFHENRVVTVIDRAYVIADDPQPSWLGSAPIFHAGWRSRPDNLYAMGPLDNLVGMQYRIDHLENLRADVFDQIAMPMLKIRGDVEDFEYEPGGRVYLGEEGDVASLVPDGSALNADFQIRDLQQKMEELAGAPRNAMGLRTPGEKTAFEVQTLDNAANRIFQHKAAKFEMEFLEPALNAMLEAARRNMMAEDTIGIIDDRTGYELFSSITREDLSGNGKIIPQGARHFQERAKRVQTLTQFIQLKADPTVAPHISGKTIARILAEELDEPTLFGENIAIREQMETQTAAQDAEADMMEGMQIKAEMGM